MKTKVKIPWIFLLIITLAAVAVGYLVYQSYQLSNKLTTSSAVSQNIPSPIANQTANWKTYVANGFTFKYPLDWQVGQPAHFPDNYTLQPSAIFNSESQKDRISISLGLSCMNTQCLSIFNLDDYVRQWNVHVLGQRIVDNMRADKVTMPNGDTAYMLVKDKIAVTISTDKYLTELDQIISTFKFTQ